MPRNITVTLQDGSQHIYQNAPDDVTPEQVTARAQKEFGSAVKHLDGGRPQGSQVKSPKGPGDYGFSDEVIDQGLMLGFGDEAKAVLGTGLDALADIVRLKMPTPGASYDRNLAIERGRRQEWIDSHPVAKVGAQILGGGLTLGAAPAAAAVNTARAAAPTLLNQIGKGSAIGASYGGAAGFGGSEGGFENRALGAAGGAATGGLLGAVIPATAAGIGGGYRAGRTMLGLNNPTDVANRHIARAIDRSGMTRDQIESGVRAANASGVPAVPADTSVSMRRLGRAVETVPGRGSDAATRFLEERQVGQGDRVSRQISRALGNDGNAIGMAESIMQARRNEAGPLYQKAYEAQAWDDRLAALFKRPAMREAFNRARTLAENEGVDPRTLGITGFNEAGDPMLSGIPTMRTWDYMKRGLDDILEKNRNQLTGRLELDESGRAINGLKNTLLRELDGINPDYAAARRAYAGHSEMLDALNLGREFAKGDIDVVAQRISEMGPAEQDMFRVGAVRELRRGIGKAQDGADIVRQMFGSPEKRQRLQMLFRTPEEFQTFQRIMEMERETTRTARMVTGGSPTGRIAAEQDDLLSGALEDAVRGNGPVAMARNAAVRMISKAKGINEDVAERIASYLFNQNPQAAAPDTAMINGLLEQAARRRFGASTAGRALSIGSAPSSRDR